MQLPFLQPDPDPTATAEGRTDAGASRKGGIFSGFADAISTALDRLRAGDPVPEEVSAHDAMPADGTLPDGTVISTEETESEAATEGADPEIERERQHMAAAAPAEMVRPAEVNAESADSPATRTSAISGNDTLLTAGEQDAVDAAAIIAKFLGADGDRAGDSEMPNVFGTAEPASDRDQPVDQRPLSASSDVDVENALDIDGEERPIEILAARRGTPLADAEGDTGNSDDSPDSSTDESGAIGNARTRDARRSADGAAFQNPLVDDASVSEVRPNLTTTGEDPAATLDGTSELNPDAASDDVTDDVVVATEAYDATLADPARVDARGADRVRTVVQVAARSSVPVAWLKAMMDNGLQINPASDGWNSLTVKLGESDGTMTVDARRDDDRVAINIAFSDSGLRTSAIENIDRLEAALRAHYQASVDLSFSGERHDHREPAGGRNASPGDAASPSERQSSAPARAVRSAAQGATHEWIG